MQTISVIRASTVRICTTQAELAGALDLPCTTDVGFDDAQGVLDDLDIDEIAFVAGYAIYDGSARGTACELRKLVRRRA